MILAMLRQILIDRALDTRDREMFARLTSPGWKRIVCGSDDTEQGDVVTNYLVLCDRDSQRVVSITVSDSDRPTAFAVNQREWDGAGWRDPYGLTFYDRLRTAGHRQKNVWVSVNSPAWNLICQTHRVVHPRDLMVAHPSRRLYVHDTHHLWESAQ